MQIFERHVQTSDQQKGSAVGKQGSASSSNDPDDQLKNNQSGPTNEAAPSSSSDPSQTTSNQLSPASQQIPPPSAPANNDQKQFDPATDLNIFEQINFDEMNINLEDINQANQKQDVINSSNSDCGDLVAEDMPENIANGNENSLDENEQYMALQALTGVNQDPYDDLQYWQE